MEPRRSMHKPLYPNGRGTGFKNLSVSVRVRQGVQAKGTQMLINFMGQKINPGDYVFRGARSGNTSEFKMGRVVDVKPDGSVRVHWLVGPGGFWFVDPVTQKRHMRSGLPHTLDSYGTIKDVSGLCVLSQSDGAAILSFRDYWERESKRAHNDDFGAVQRILDYFKE
jgi:hypothetical protein